MQKTYQKGMTMIEILIIIAILGILVAITVPAFLKFRQQQALQNTTNGIVSVLNEARTKTLAAVNNTSYSVYLTTTSATLFTGTTYSANASTNEIYAVESPATLSWSLQGASAVISFDRLKGTTSQYGTITINLSNGLTKTITITTLGSVARS